MSKILITGGAGFIGTHLAERLSGTNKIVLLDSFRRDSLSLAPDLKTNKNVEVVAGDVLDPGSIEGAIAGCKTVIHLAAIAGVSSYYSEPLRTLRTNILGTVNVLEAAAGAGIDSFVYFSTSEIHGPDAMWVDEDCPAQIGAVTDKRWVYATSKLAGENFAMRYAQEHGFRCNVVRPFNIYGPRQVGEGAISNFCRAAATGDSIRVYGDGSAIRAWCYVTDLVDAVEAILNNKEINEEIFNIGNPREVETTRGLARRVAQLSPKTGVENEPGKHKEVRGRIPVIDKARKLLGYEPKVDLTEGLTKTLDWFTQNEKN